MRRVVLSVRGTARWRGRAVLATVLAAAVLATGGCSRVSRSPSADPSASGGSSAAPGPGTGDIMDESRALVGTAFRGTYKPPDATPRPAARGKRLVVISGGQTSPTSAIPTAGAVEAGRALGWDVQVLDMQLNPANAPRLVKQAVAAGVDGIVANFDCILAPAELADAKARGIQLVALYGFDCDDPSFGPRKGPPLFTTFVNYGLDRLDAPQYTAGFGALIASAIITETNGTAKVISFTDPSQTILRYIQLGFLKQMARCTGCQVLETVEFAPNELGPALTDKAVAALQRHPDATVIRTPFSAATQLSLAPALVRTGRHEKMMVIGGEGFPADLDLIRTAKGLTMTFWIDSQWTGWAAVDALNSEFVAQPARAAGFGTMLLDRNHNLPPSGPAQHNIDFKGIYRRAWGVG